MKVLIVDGNEKSASDRYTELGMLTQYEVYKKVLENIADIELDIIVIHPANFNDFLPKGINLDDFDGIVWTGSVLNIYDYGPSIERQIDLAKNLFTKENKIFGSWWGLQVLATAAGGSVRKNPKGLEAVIAKNITLNEKGNNHPMYKGKPKVFDSFCWHYDEIEKLPNETIVLSSNDQSNVQSISFSKNQSKVWAVQYHPEFNPHWMSGLMDQRKKLLLDNNIFSTEEEYEKLYSFFTNIFQNHKLKNELSISDTLIVDDIHTIELKNWLEYLKSEI